MRGTYRGPWHIAPWGATIFASGNQCDTRNPYTEEKVLTILKLSNLPFRRLQ